MKIENKDMPAMPLTGDAYHDFERAVHYQDASYNPECQGLTKREYFAAIAMQGIMANPNCEPVTKEHFKNIASDAINIAEVLLEELEK